MRISGWGSDVCSSDLRTLRSRWSSGRLRSHRPQDHCGHLRRRGPARRRRFFGQGSFESGSLRGVCSALRREEYRRLGTDRKSVVWGNSVYVRVELGGRRRRKKKKQNKTKNTNK